MANPPKQKLYFDLKIYLKVRFSLFVMFGARKND